MGKNDVTCGHCKQVIEVGIMGRPIKCPHNTSI